jgi:hypothetical protein
MELLLSKSQKSSMMGAVSFVLDIRTKLTPDEQALVKKYKMGNLLVYEKLPISEMTTHMGGAMTALTAIASKVLKLQITVDNLVNGRKVECKDIGEMISAQGQIRSAADNFYALLMAAHSFEGEEVITYPRADSTS